MLIWYFSNNLDIYYYVGKLPNQNFNARLFSNPGDKLLFLLKFDEGRISEWNITTLYSFIFLHQNVTLRRWPFSPCFDIESHRLCCTDLGHPKSRMIFKGELLFNSVEQVKLIHVHWLCPSSKMHHFLAQQRFDGIFGFVCARFPKK